MTTARTANIISIAQAQLLAALHLTGGQSRTELLTITALPDRKYYPAMQDLRERDLVKATVSVGRRRPDRLSITVAGSRALADHTRRVAAALEAQAKGAPAQAITFTTQGTRYVPPKGVFYRNNGNSHIASFGARC